MIKKYFLYCSLFLIGLFNFNLLYSQCTPCGSPTTVPVNLSANPDTTFSMTSTRSGLCCGATGTNCIRFDVTINPGANEVSFNVANPAPPGGAFYQVNCGPPTSLGTPLCVTGMTSFCIVFCKSGGDSPTYTISSSRTFSASPDITINSNCVGELYVEGLVQSSITWNSIAPGAAGTYNSYLNCTSACDTTYITPQAGYPTFIDYQVCGTPTGCASGTSCDTVRVNLVPGLEVAIDPAAATICSGNPITLTANITGGTSPYNYLWSPGGQTTSAISVSVPGTYIVSVTDSTNCPAATDTIVVGAAPNPSPPDINSNSPICEGATLNLTASTVVGATYNWTGPNGFTSTQQNPSIPAATVAASGTYTVSITVAGCTSNDTTTTVVVNPIPNAPTAGSNSPICEGTTLNLTASTITGATYSWTGPNGFTSTTQNPSIAGVTAAAAGTYSVTATVAGCTGPAGTTTVTIEPSPTSPTAGSNSPICEGTTLNLTASTITGATYNWTGPNGFTSTTQNPSIAGVTAAAAGTYSVTATVAGCTGPAGTTVVVVNPIPAAPTAGSNSPICEGTTLNLTASTITGATYNWTGPNGFTSTTQNPSISGVTAAAAGTYSVTATVAGCTGPAGTTVVVVNPIPAAPTVGSNSPVCEGTTLNLTASTIAGASYNWTGPNGFTSTTQNPSIAGVTAAAAGTYSVTATVAGCTGPAGTTVVVVNPIPAAPTAGSNSPVCEGTTLNLTASTITGATYNWTGPNGFTSTTQNPSISGVTAAAAGTYSVTATVAGCTGPAGTTVVVVNPIPAAPTAGSNSPVCEGTTLNLTASTITGATYNWTGPNGFTSTTQNPSIAGVTAAAAGTYSVTATVAGCTGSAGTTIVTIEPLPAAPTASGTTICEGNSATLTATAPGGTYEWYNAPTGGTLLFTGATYTTPVLTTTDTFYVQTTVNGCPGPRTAVIVTVTPTDDASFSYSSSTYCITGTDPTPTINGSFGGTFTSSPAGLVINSSTGSIDVSASALNTYTITFTTSGPCPNSSSVSVTITNAPDATFSYTTPICQSGSNELPSFPPGASAGVFSASPAGLVFVNTSTGEINTAASAFGTYTITNFIAAAGGCSSASANFTITIDEAATVNAGTYSDICAGTTLSLNGTIGGSATTGTWSGGTGTYAPNANTLNATYTPSAAEQTAGIVTLILTTNNPASACSAVADTVSVNIIPLPAAPTVNDTTICEGNTATLTATSPGGTYEWYDAPTGGNLVNTGATYLTPTLTTTTSYYVQTAVNGCVGPRTTVTVTVNPTPVAPTVIGDTICAGESTTLTATAPGGTYDWYDAPTGGTLLFTGANYTTPALTTPDTFYVQTTVLGCPSTRTMVIVVVNPIPTAPIVGNATICDGNTATLTATSPGGTYEWYDAPTGGNLVNTGATYTTPILTTTTSYYVQTTVNGCTSAMTTVTVTVNPIPVAPTVNDTTICEGNAVTLTATAPGGTYRWYNAPTGGTLLNTGATYTTPVLTTTTTYYVQTTVGGCTSPRTSVTVTVIPNDDPSFSYSSGTFCITGTDPTPTVTGTSGGTFSASPSGLTLNPSTGEITVSSSTLGTYTVTYTTNGTCPMSSSVSVTITTAPDATFSYNDPFCQFTTNPLPIFPIGSSAGVFSATPAGLNFVNTSTGEIDLSTSASGTYTVTNFIAASGGCASATHSTTITIEAAAIVNAGNDTTICVGDLAALNGSIGGSATAATWSGGAGTFNPNNTTLNATYTPTAGEYLAGSVSLVLTTNNPGGVCTAASDTVIITFNEDDPSFTYSSGTYCATGTNPVPNITGGSTGTFSATPAGLVFVNSATGEINLGASALGTYTVSFTTNGSCPASSSMSITITNGFDASFSYTTPVCQGGANEFPSFTPGASSGIFSATPSGLVFVNTSTGEIDMTASTPGTYTVTNFIAASGGCASATHSTTFTIDVSATVNAGADMSICFGDNAPLSGAIGGSATSGTWSGGLGTFSPNNTTLTATYTPDPSETLVTLILTSDDPAGPCSAVSDTVVITINPIPLAPTASNDTICEGTSTTLIATAPGGTYEWYSASSGGTLLQTGASFTTPVLSTTTTYYVQTTVNGCTSSTRTPVTVTVTPLDDPSFSYSSATFCVSGGNATPVITGGSTGSFSATPSGLVFVDSLTGEIDVALTTLGTYTVTFTTDGVCPDSATFTVTITNAPDATFSYNDPFCTNGSNPTPTFPPGSSAGVFSALPAGLVFVSTSTGQINLSATTPGVYAVTNDIAAAGGCAAASYTDSVEILPAPLADAGVDTSVCANNAQVDLSGSIANAGGMSWTTSGDGIFTPDTISANVTYNAGTNDTANGSVTIYLTTTQNGFCSAAVDSIVLTITPAPVVDAGSDILICNGTLTTTLNGSVSGGSSTGAWTTMGTGTFSPDSLTLNASYTFSQQDSINGSVILILESTNNGGCLAVYDTVEVFLSSPATVFAGNDTTICANNDSIQLNGQVLGGTGAGVWSSSGNGTFTPSANDLNASYQIDSSDIDNGSVMLILDAVNSCVPAADTIVITINPAPIADAGNNFSICEGETASLNGSITNAGGGEWTTDGTGTFVPDNFTLNAQYIPSAGDMVNGTVTLVLTTTNNGLCDAVSDTITLTISPLPIADFIPQGGQFNINQVIDFMNQSQNATTYFWDFGNNGDTSILSNPSYSYGANGIYTVTLIATNAAGCVDTITYDFEIIGDDVKPVVVPTAFSPNGDGNNDVFSILGGPFESYKLTVYNEWGQEIFMSDDQADGWDGTFKGTSQPSGSYVYVFTGVTIADETITLQGEIAIIR